jgi:2-aminobenzoate-CoA ligase
VHFGTDAPGGLDALMRDKPERFAACDTAADDTALIAFTSGTTGQGKGTMHAHRDVLAITDCFPRYVLRPSADDLFCGSPPLAFTYALGGLLLFPLRFGACALLLEQATPPHLVKAIQEFRPTVCFTAPTAYRAMCGMLPEHDVSSLRKCVSAGETLPRSVFDAWHQATGLRIIDGIGATEMLHIFISAADDDIRPGATGKVVPGYQARVVDDDMRDLPPGVVGRLAVRGPTGCRYRDDADRQREYVRDGWNLTGDSYARDADGYFWYQARTDDIIISSGYNIAGPEVENVLLEHEAVLECAVVGAPDPERGQVVKAVVVLRPGRAGDAALVKELQDFVKARIAPYKYPRAVEFADALPRAPARGCSGRRAGRRRAATPTASSPPAATWCSPGRSDGTRRAPPSRPTTSQGRWRRRCATSWPCSPRRGRRRSTSSASPGSSPTARPTSPPAATSAARTARSSARTSLPCRWSSPPA